MEPKPRIRFLPHEYWQITKKMSPNEIDQLMHEVECLAEAEDFAALGKYPFIFRGEKCHCREASAGVS